jgi:hypothetical protein
MRIGEEDFARNVGSVGAKRTASAVLLDPDGTVGLKVVDCTAQRMLQGAHRSLSCRSPAIEHPATMRMPRMPGESAPDHHPLTTGQAVALIDSSLTWRWKWMLEMKSRMARRHSSLRSTRAGTGL